MDLMSPSTTTPHQQARLKEIAKSLGGQTQLAKKARIHKSTITKLIKGDRGLGTAVARKIATAAGVGINDLLQEQPPREDTGVGVMRRTEPFSSVDQSLGPESTRAVGGVGYATPEMSPQMAKLRALELARQNGARGEILEQLLDASPPAGREGDPWWWAEELLRLMRAPAPPIPKR